MSTTKQIDNDSERLGASISDQLASHGVQTKMPNAKERKRREAALRAASTTTPAISAKASVSKPAEAESPRLTLPILDIFKQRKATSVSADQLQEKEENWEPLVQEDINIGVEYLWSQRDAINKLSGVQLELREEDINKFQRELLSRGGLMKENDVMRRYEVRTFARRIMQTCPLDESDVLWMVEFLVPFGFFQITGKNDAKANFIFGQFVKLGEEYQDGDSKVTAMGISKIQDDIKAERRANWIKSQKAIKVAAGSKESQLLIDQVGYQNGLKLLMDPGWTDNQGHERRGGDILLKSHEDGFMEILMGTSGCQRIADQAVEFGISINIKEINNGQLNRIASSDEEIKRATFAVFKTLQRAINFAFDEAEEAAGRVAEREHFQSLVTLNAEQFHTVPRPKGAYLVDPLAIGASYLVPKFFNRKPLYKDGKPVLVQAGPDATDVFYLFVSGDDGKLTQSPFPTRLKDFFSRNPAAFGRLVQMDREKFERSKVKSVPKTESIEDIEAHFIASEAAETPAIANTVTEAVAPVTKPAATPRKKRAPKAKSGRKTSSATAEN